jgi:hypothetical protein
MSLREFYNWCIDHKKELVASILIFLVATASFALGYLFGRDMTRAPIIIEKAANLTPDNFNDNI